MNDDEYIIDIVYNCNGNKMLQNLASAYTNKFYKNLEMRSTVVQYAVSSYLEPECFPNRTPIYEIPDMILNNTVFINEIINKLSETNDLDKFIVELIDSILNKIKIIPDEYNEIIYHMLEILLNNNNVLIFYSFNKFKNFELLFNPRLIPDIQNYLIIPKDKDEIFELSKYFDHIFKKVSNIILLFCKNKGARQNMITWLYNFIEKNKNRKKTNPDSDCSSDGIVLNFLGSLFELCEPFISIYSSKNSKIDVNDINKNFISQCFDMTSKMVDYGFLTCLNKFQILSFRFNNDSNNEYILNTYHSQMGNSIFIQNLKKFTLLQIYIINKNTLNEEIIESVWKTIEYLKHLNMIDYEICKYSIEHFSSSEIKNPHLRCEIGKITAMLLQLNLYPLNDQIISKLLKLYGNLQNIGANEKLMCRSEIAKCIDLYDIKKLDLDILNEFCFGLLSETDTLISKALDEFMEVKSKIDKNEDLDERYEGEVKMNFEIANEILLLLKKISSLIPNCFNNECSIKKLATSWSFMIYRLIGPQCLKLKVSNPLKYNFDPKKMLFNILSIFNKLKSKNLLEEIGKVGLLDHTIFSKMIKILKRERIFDETQINEFKQLLSEINIKIDSDDAPDDFYDAIMGTIMSNPVKLPSGNLVDKTTIIQHLKNDTSDPFTRQELKEEDLVYDDELKKRIDEWMQ